MEMVFLGQDFARRVAALALEKVAEQREGFLAMEGVFGPCEYVQLAFELEAQRRPQPSLRTLRMSYFSQARCAVRSRTPVAWSNKGSGRPVGPRGDSIQS